MKTVKLMALAITLTVTLSLTAQQSNESIVRETYAKLMFANQVGAIESGLLQHNQAMLQKPVTTDLNQMLKNDQLSITLGNFKESTVMGNTDPLISLVTDFAGKPVLSTSININEWSIGGKKFTEVTVTALKPAVGPGVGGDISKLVIGDINTLVPKDQDPRRWSRLIQFNITVNHRGKTVGPYKAAFLFTDDGEVMADDPYLNGLGSLVKANVYPDVLLHTLNTNTAVVEWIKANTAPDDKSKVGQMYCDLSALKCMIPPSAKEAGIGHYTLCDAECQMRAALSPPSFDNRNPDYCTPPFCPTCPIYNYSLQGEMPGTPIRGTVQHVSGSHSLSGLWTNACTYTNGPYLGNGYYACIANLSETSTGLALEGGTLQHLYTHSVATELTVAGGSLATYPQVRPGNDIGRGSC